jgi:dimethylglycine dehydrogenase
MVPIYEALMREGAAFGIANYGLYAVNSMRMEKGYKAWGSELTNELTLIEADMERFFAKGKEFTGKEGTLRGHHNDPVRPFRIVELEIDASDVDARGAEPVLVEGRPVGLITSGAYGHRVKRSLAFAAVELELATPGTQLQVMLQGETRPAHVLAGPPYDPDNARMKV